MLDKVSMGEYFWEVACEALEDEPTEGLFALRVDDLETPFQELVGKGAVIVELVEGEFRVEIFDDWTDAIRTVNLRHATRIYH